MRISKNGEGRTIIDTKFGRITITEGDDGVLIHAEPTKGCHSTFSAEMQANKPMKSALFPQFKRPEWI